MSVGTGLRGIAYVSAGLMIGVANIASAQEPRWYFGGSVGQSNLDMTIEDLAAVQSANGFTISGTELNDTADAWKVFGGYMLNQHFAVEAGYVNLGEFEFDATAAGTFLTGAEHLMGFNLVAVGTYPVTEQFAVFGKAGAFRWESEYERSGGGGPTIDDISNRTDPTYGVGVRWSFSDQLHLRAEWERFENVGTGFGETDGRPVDLGTIGLVWSY